MFHQDLKSTCCLPFFSEIKDGTKKNTLNHEVEQQTAVPSNQHMGFHLSSHLNLLERNHAVWNHSNTSCFHYTTGLLRHHMIDNFVNLAPNHRSAKHCCCDCFHRKLEQSSSCLSCLSSAPKTPPGVTQNLALPRCCSGTNHDCACHIIYFPKREPFHPKSSPATLKRVEFEEKEVGQRIEKRPIGLVEKDIERAGSSGTDLKVLQKGKMSISKSTYKKDTDGTMDEIPAKKIKMSITNILDTKVKYDSQKMSTLKETTQLNIAEVKKTNDYETERELASHIKIKKEISEPQNANTDKKEHCNSEVNSQEKHETTPMDVQQNLPYKVARKPQHSKSKRASKDGIVKHYNTRVATTWPRVYSSDFVNPEEEDDWKQDREEFQVKSQQRSKLNRLLANEHERRRVAQLNNAYQDLRQLIPGYQCDTKLPKIKILKYAINYIAHLDKILGAGSIQEV